MLVVRMFLRGYLFVWLQYLVSKEEFLFLKSPRGFRRIIEVLEERRTTGSREGRRHPIV
jgi:hypothetical protein